LQIVIVVILNYSIFQLNWFIFSTISGQARPATGLPKGNVVSGIFKGSTPFMLHNQQQQSTEGANVNKKDTKHTKEQAAHGL